MEGIMAKQKNKNTIRDGMVYFGCLQVKAHIQAVQNMCSKGG